MPTLGLALSVEWSDEATATVDKTGHNRNERKGEHPFAEGLRVQQKV